jgi:F0F1-type ATP synthase membrane subunit a
MLISSILIIIFFIAGTRRVNIVPGKIQLLNELVFNFISKMINETVWFQLLDHIFHLS